MTLNQMLTDGCWLYVWRHLSVSSISFSTVNICGSIIKTDVFLSYLQLDRPCFWSPSIFKVFCRKCPMTELNHSLRICSLIGKSVREHRNFFILCYILYKCWKMMSQGRETWDAHIQDHWPPSVGLSCNKALLMHCTGREQRGRRGTRVPQGLQKPPHIPFSQTDHFMNHTNSWRSHQHPDQPHVFTTYVHGPKTLKTETAVQKIRGTLQMYSQLSSTGRSGNIKHIPVTEVWKRSCF